MNTVSKMTVGGILTVLVVFISWGSYSMIRINAQGSSGSIREAQISNIPEILACQKLDPSWSPPFPLSDTRESNSTAAQLFDAKDCWKQLERDPITGELPSSFPTTEPVMTDVLDLHNRERAAVGFPPLTWSNTLAAESKSWATHLTTLGAAYCNNPKNNCHGANNENIAWACSGCMTLDSMAQLWANEKAKYNAGQHSGPGIGHWTAMVWKSTREVGCGISSNGETNFLVCRYLPGGNAPSTASRAANLPNY